MIVLNGGKMLLRAGMNRRVVSESTKSSYFAYTSDDSHRVSLLITLLGERHECPRSGTGTPIFQSNWRWVHRLRNSPRNS
eukprot:gene2874-biopygen11720